MRPRVESGIMDRRTFLKGLGASAILGPSFLGCASPVPKQVPGFRGLDQLPYFKVDRDGNLVLAARDVPEGIDFHTHLGVSFLLAPEVDLLRRTARPEYILDYDAEEPPCPFDLEEYISATATPAMIEGMEKEVKSALFQGSRKAQTHSVPNLLAEMDRVGIRKSVVLGLAPGLSPDEDLTERWGEAIRRAGATERLILFGAVPPKDPRAIEKLRRQKESLGIRGIKFHPMVHRCAPNDPAAMRLFEECGRLDLPVFFHTGKPAMGPVASRAFADMKNFVEPVSSFPKIPFVFGHAGNRDWKEALPIAKDHENVWLELHGQGLTALRTIVSEADRERLLFGSDWPWYPIAASLAKILIVTERDRKLRSRILRDNAERFLG